MRSHTYLNFRERSQKVAMHTVTVSGLLEYYAAINAKFRCKQFYLYDI
jgi:hypothetical protein